jgi:hypothetical protein
VPFSDLDTGAGMPVAFFVAVYDAASAERERHPEHRPIELRVPDARFVANLWSA